MSLTSENVRSTIYNELCQQAFNHASMNDVLSSAYKKPLFLATHQNTCTCMTYMVSNKIWVLKLQHIQISEVVYNLYWTTISILCNHTSLIGQLLTTWRASYLTKTQPSVDPDILLWHPLLANAGSGIHVASPYSSLLQFLFHTGGGHGVASGLQRSNVNYLPCSCCWMFH